MHTPHPTTVILTHHHLAHDHPIHPGPHLRLLTTHPPDTPPPNPGTTHASRTTTSTSTSTATADGRYHRHLPPHPDPATLTDAIHALLTPTTDNQTRIGRSAGLDNHQPPTRGSGEPSPAGRRM